MKTLFSTIFIFLGSFLKTAGQSKDIVEAYDKISSHFHYDTYEYSFTKNEKWAKNLKTMTFENQGNIHSTYIALNSDSTFIFLSLYEPGEFLTTGNWTTKNDSIFILTWDKQKSLDICRNRKIYEKYYKYSTPMTMKIDNWVFIKRKDKLIPVTKSEVNQLTPSE